MWIMWKAVWVYYIRKVQAFQGWLLHNVDYVKASTLKWQR